MHGRFREIWLLLDFGRYGILGSIQGALTFVGSKQDASYSGLLTRRPNLPVLPEGLLS